MDGRIPIGVDEGQNAEPDIDTVGTTEVGDDPSTAGNFQHDHPAQEHTTSDHTIDNHDDHIHEVSIPDHDEHHHHLNLNANTDESSGLNVTVDENTSDEIDSVSDNPTRLDHPTTDSEGANITLQHTGSLGHDTLDHDLAAINQPIPTTSTSVTTTLTITVIRIFTANPFFPY